MKHRTVIIGDVHGCLTELQDLLSRVEATREDTRLIFLGDLVDRGPDSIGCVELVAQLARDHDAVCIAGNHEEKALRHHRRGTVDKWGEPWANEATEEHWSFIEQMPLVHRVPSMNMLCVHGGLYPAYFEKHGEIGEPNDPWHKGGGKRMDRMRRFLRVRHVKDTDGQMVVLGDEGPGTRHWSEWYDGREGFVFYGHDPQLDGNPRLTEHTVGLDTACVFGACLTAAILPVDAPVGCLGPQFVRVPALDKYADPRLE